MIKKIKHPDGTEETIIGTPTEITEYENRKIPNILPYMPGPYNPYDPLISPGGRWPQEDFTWPERNDNGTGEITIPHWWEKNVTITHPWPEDSRRDFCLIEDFIKKNPELTSIGIVCYCRKCSVTC